VQVIIRRVKGISLVGKADSDHWVPMDGPESLGGEDAGSRPIELFAIGLGGCTGMDVLSILQKKRVALDDFEMRIDVERADEHPKVFTKVHTTYVFYGNDLEEKHLARAIELSQEKYCSASKMLSQIAELTYSHEVRPPRGSRD
jgi:putative redox protein